MKWCMCTTPLLQTATQLTIRISFETLLTYLPCKTKVGRFVSYPISTSLSPSLPPSYSISPSQSSLPSLSPSQSPCLSTSLSPSLLPSPSLSPSESPCLSTSLSLSLPVSPYLHLPPFWQNCIYNMHFHCEVIHHSESTWRIYRQVLWIILTVDYHLLLGETCPAVPWF